MSKLCVLTDSLFPKMVICKWPKWKFEKVSRTESRTQGNEEITNIKVNIWQLKHITSFPTVDESFFSMKQEFECIIA